MADNIGRLIKAFSDANKRKEEFDYTKDRNDFNDAKSNFEDATSELTGSKIDNAIYDELLKSVPETDNPRLTEYY